MTKKMKTSALIEAVKADDIKLVKRLLNNGVDVNAIDKDGFIALILACMKDMIDVAKLLIDSGADVNAIDKDGFDRTALMWTSARNKTDVAKLLIDSGADVNIKNDNGMSALMWASLNKNRIDVAKLLIDNGADISAKNDNGVTALMWTSSKNNIDVAKLLIDSGADIEAKDDDGKTALMWASIQNNLSIAKFLIDKGAKIKNVSLDLVCIFEYKDMLTLLIDNDIPVNNEELNYSILLGYTDIVKILLTKEIDLNKKDDDSFISIDYAYDNSDIRALLIKKGVRSIKKLTDDDKEKIDSLKKEVISLIDNSEEISEKMHSPFLFDKNDIKQILNMQRKHSQTAALIEAIKNKYNYTEYKIDLIENIVSMGVDLDYVDKKGKSAWDYAIESKDSDTIIDILKRQDELTKPTYNPKRVVELLSNFTIDTPIKYTTHRWDFGDVKKKHDNFNGFIESVETHWRNNIKNELQELTPNLHEKIEDFLRLWKNTKGLKEWCESGNDPFDFENFSTKINEFKYLIEIRTENNILEEIFFEIEESFKSEHSIEHRNLKGKQFYTDVESLKIALKKIFNWIKEREKHTNIIVEATNTTGEYIELTITHIGSFSNKDANELLKKGKSGGDFSDIKEVLKNLCDWSVEDNKHRINYLVSDDSINDIEELDEKVTGFRHVFRFYK